MGNFSFRPGRRAPRGYILAFVLVMLLMLTVLATSVLKTSVSEAAALDASLFQNQAVINSSAGVQDALARLRSNQVAWATLPLCGNAEICMTLTPPPFVITAPLGGAMNVPPYVVTVFQRPRQGIDGLGTDTMRGNQTPVVVVSSRGQSQDNDQYTAVIEVEVQMPSGGGQGNTVAGGG